MLTADCQPGKRRTKPEQTRVYVAQLFHATFTNEAVPAP